jgi:hypothetical protein
VPSGSRPVQGSWHQHHLPEAIFEDETRREIIKTEGKDSFDYHNREIDLLWILVNEDVGTLLVG